MMSNHHYCYVFNCKHKFSGKASLHRLPKKQPELARNLLRGLDFPEDFKPPKSFRICSLHFTDDSIDVINGKARLKKNPVLKSSNEVNVFTQDLFISSMEKARIKDYCQFCLKLQNRSDKKKQINSIDQENFFKLTQIKLDTSIFNDCVCDSCFNKFLSFIKYRDHLINNQEILSKLLNSLDFVSVKEERDSETETFDWLDLQSDIKVETWEENPAALILDGNEEACKSPEPETFDEIPVKRIRKKPTKTNVQNFSSASKKDKRLEVPMICDECGKQFYYRSRILVHIRDIHRATSTVCHICAKEFSNNRNLTRHLIVHQTEEEKRFQCERCPKRFNAKNNYLRHLRHHDGIKAYVCHICSKAFVQKTTLNDHLNIHNKVRFKCELCPRDFSVIKNMKDHMLKCALGIGQIKRRGINPQKRIQPIYNCYAEGCTRKFTVREHLGRHLEKIHKMDIKNFDVTCHICQKVSPSSGEHLIHMKIHTCSFVCDQCQVRCKTADALRTHMENRHKDDQERLFVCEEPDCGARFKNMGHLRSHNISKHSTQKPRYECEFCKKLFHQRFVLNSHLKVHTNERPFSCWQCDYNSASSSRLRIHMRSIHDETNIYKCKTCEKTFVFQKELLAHEKDH